jgi:hypothetical protein
LGFGHYLKTEANASGKYSENEIYQHITNCQTFLSYNVDETKLLKRREAFKNSIALLMDLTSRGTIAQATALGSITAYFMGTTDNAMTELGRYISRKILAYESNTSKAAAILLLVCLDFAYNSVNSVRQRDLSVMAPLTDCSSSPPSSMSS